MKRIAFLLLLFSSFAFGQQKITWPQHKKAVIVLTYDDAINSQLDIAIPQLDAAHLKGTFFLIGYSSAANIPRWRAVAAKGHELANHTLYHPCLSNTNGIKEKSSDAYSLFSIVREIGMMNNFLFAIDGKQTRTYAYPCTETKVDGESYVEALRKSGFIKYARIGGDENAVITDFKNLDPLLVPSWAVSEGTPGDKLIGFVKKVEESGGMGVFMFHGIGGDYITTPAQAHQELVDYLQQHKNDILVLTFQQAMDYITSANKRIK